MFRGASSFNGDLSSWNVASVINMDSMFYGAENFNGNLDGRSSTAEGSSHTRSKTSSTNTGQGEGPEEGQGDGQGSYTRSHARPTVHQGRLPEPPPPEPPTTALLVASDLPLTAASRLPSFAGSAGAGGGESWSSLAPRCLSVILQVG